MIVRNESATIKRCLDSVRDWVDYMVVIDTGSSDDTVRVAQAAGARVGHFQWIDDFSAARNYSLTIANADWNLVLDADESVVVGAADIGRLRLVKPDFVAAVRIDSNFEVEGNASTASSWISRVLPKGVGYAGVVHEQPLHTLAIHRLSVHVAHAGYLPQAMAAKIGRNASLLEKALIVRPGDGYLLYQLGKDYLVYQRYADAVRTFVEADLVLGQDHHLAHDLLIRWLFALKKLAQFEVAVALAESRMTQWAQSPDYWFVVGDLLLDFACSHPEKAQELMPMIEASWLRCLEIGERPDLEGAVHGRGSYLPAQNLAVIYEGSGRADDAHRCQELAASFGRSF
ncbi:MAG: glycosyltransferase family 2 protein [Rhodoferax sp.]|nr:glycosyltransferase family 2 protein [Rhodoferax sp.]